MTAEIANGVAVADSLFALELEAENLEGLQLVISNDAGEEVRIRVEADQLVFDRTRSGMVDFSEVFPATHKAPLEGLTVSHMRVFVDLSSVEVFLNDGHVVMTELVFPKHTVYDGCY